MKTGPKPIPLAVRLMKKVTKQSSGCWIFNGAKYGSGYGVIKSDTKEIIGAHRASYIVHRGEIPKDMVVMHVCDIKLCVNPEHLKLGTPADNLNDMRQKGRHSHGESHGEAIKRGWTPEKRKEHSRRVIQAKLDKRLDKARKAGMPLDWKLCPKCKEWQPMTNFSNNRARSDGTDSYCKPCKY